MSEEQSPSSSDKQSAPSADPAVTAPAADAATTKTTAPPPAPPPSATPPPVAPPHRHEWVATLALILAVLAFAASGGLFLFMQTRMQDVEVQLARRIGEFDVSSREARAAAKAARATIDDLATRIGGLESKTLEAQNQQVALGAMYQELARSQDERMLADIEQTLLLADQQLHMAGNVRAALLGLEAAEARLARAEKPQFDRLRQAIGKDVARLKLLPAADVTGINARLDALLGNVDQLKAELEPEAAVKPAPAEPEGAVGWLGLLGRETWEEIKQLVRIRRIDHPDLALLTPSQSYFLRQNLKLRLLSARLAVLQRDEATYRSDMAAAQRWIEQYFKPQDAVTQSMLQEIKALQGVPVAIKEAHIADSLKVLRAMPGRPD